jgi:hypothetical protein
MKAKLITHVSDLILLVCSARQSLKRTLFDIVACDRRPCVARLGQTSFEYFHYTVRICMTVGISGTLDTFLVFHTSAHQRLRRLKGIKISQSYRSSDVEDASVQRPATMSLRHVDSCLLPATGEIATNQQTTSTNCDSERIRSAFV